MTRKSQGLALALSLVAVSGCSKENSVLAEQADTICAAGEYSCQVRTLRICNDSRTGWIEVDICGEGTRCDVLNKSCVGDGTGGPGGSPWQDASAGGGGSSGSGNLDAGGGGTPGDDASDSSGECETGARKCIDTTPEECDANGVWQKKTACGGENPYCIGDGQCVQCTQPNQCEEPSNPCQVGTCTSNVCGAANSPAGTSCPGGTCNGSGACFACTPGNKTCVGNTLKTCESNGQWGAGAACVNQACVGGACSGVCAPGAKKCVGATPQHCDANGIWVNDTACTGSKPHCVGQGQCVQCTLASQCTTPANPCESATCSGNTCGVGYAPLNTPCAGGACNGAGTCSSCSPGVKECFGNTLKTCQSNGQWDTGAACVNQACVGGACTGVCVPGAKQCGGNSVQTCQFDGQWSAGTACVNQACSSGSCIGLCTPGAKQCSGNTLQTCQSNGQWNGGTACVDKACVNGTCTGVCTPGAKQCTGNRVQTCGSTGQWNTGTECVGRACVGGTCTGVCSPGAKQCSGNSLQTCEWNGQWNAGTACSGATPVCDGGECVPQPSCDGLASTCGPFGNDSCCASTVIPGGTFYRSYDGVDYTDKNCPATVSDFRLDVYEVTVGRFRKFVSAYPGNIPTSGAGKNPNNASDPGWDANWSGKLAADQATLKSGLKCHSTFQTWTDSAGGNENRPLNCISWHEALAFCIWDGGRLPTEAEWNYAAAGGSEQRVYPWSSPANSTTVGPNQASYDCTGDGQPDCTFEDFVNVGTKPAGKGRWGQADMAGNVYEWALDWWWDTYPTPCDNCAQFATSSERVIRGGAIGNTPNLHLRSAFRTRFDPTAPYAYIGFRCARSAP